MCQQSGHSWKAAIFEGWRLYHNPNIKEGDNEVDSDITDVDDGFEDMPPAEIEGNANRDIWKAMAIKYCKQVIFLTHLFKTVTNCVIFRTT